MSVTQNPITGRSSGKFANSIFQTQYGRNILRSKPLEVRNPQSAAQKTQRALIAKAGQLVKAMNSFLTLVYSASVIKMPPASYIVKWLYNNALTAVGEVVTLDHSKLLPAPDALGLAGLYTVVKSTADKVIVNWTGSTLEAKTGADVEMYGLCYDVADDTFIRESGTVLSSDETMEFSVPGSNTAKVFKIYILAKRKVVRFKAGAELSGTV